MSENPVLVSNKHSRRLLIDVYIGKRALESIWAISSKTDHFTFTNTQQFHFSGTPRVALVQSHKESHTRMAIAIVEKSNLNALQQE